MVRRSAGGRTDVSMRPFGAGCAFALVLLLPGWAGAACCSCFEVTATDSHPCPSPAQCFSSATACTDALCANLGCNHSIASISLNCGQLSFDFCQVIDGT